MLADVGLVGLPNVGKSSILSCISEAKPKIANYHFTTLSPNLGVVKTGEGRGFVVADIPGLIEGASEGAGLGHEFLRHVDRCRLILHVVDISCQEGRDPIEDIKLINRELAQYSCELASRRQIVLANKYDAVPEDFDKKKFEKFVKDNGWFLIYTSAATGENLDEMVAMVESMLQQLPEMIKYESEMSTEEIVVQSDDRSVDIHVEDGVYIVEAEWLYNVMGSVNFADRESLMYFQRVLKNNKVIDALEEAGCGDGDTVSIYDFEFDFIK
jgi:GTP-binding protein